MRQGPLLRTPPPPAIGSPQALLALANALEREAAIRYRELAERMRLAQQPELEELFGFLASLEDKHGEQIAQQANRLAPDSSMPRTHVAWEVPENFDEEAARSATLSPYSALAIAVRNEERAFAFYCHAAAAAAPAHIRLIAEDLARDELRHASLLRHARRAAFRREGRHIAGRTGTDELPRTLMAFRVLADEWRSNAARHHHALAEALNRDGQQRLAVAFRQVAFEESGGNLAGLTVMAGSGPAEIRDGLRQIEVLFDRFDDIAAQTSDAAILAEAQILAENCVRWLARVGGAWRNEMID